MSVLRKTSKDYRKELSELRQKQVAIENQIKKRALDLCTRYPKVMVGKITDAGYFLQYHSEQPGSLVIDNYLHAIEAIEADLASKHPHKQTAIEF